LIKSFNFQTLLYKPLSRMQPNMVFLLPSTFSRFKIFGFSIFWLP